MTGRWAISVIASILILSFVTMNSAFAQGEPPELEAHPIILILIGIAIGIGIGWLLGSTRKK